MSLGYVTVHHTFHVNPAQLGVWWGGTPGAPFLPIVRCSPAYHRVALGWSVLTQPQAVRFHKDSETAVVVVLDTSKAFSFVVSLGGNFGLVPTS